MEIFLLILIICFIFWPWISKWLREFMAHRAEDMVRRMAGMPSRKEEARRRRQQEKQQKQQEGYYKGSRRGNSRTYPTGDGISSMQEYAEDVEFTETKDYSDTDVFDKPDSDSRRTYRESQVSDAEYTEIKE